MNNIVNQMQRLPVITGNWKMHKTLEEAKTFVEQLLPVIEHINSKIYLAVPFTLIQSLSEQAKGNSLVIGAQNMNDASEGAFTGEIAGRMLKDAGAQFVLLGHSERRTLYHEDNAFINRKIKRAIECGLQPILCVGENSEEYEAGRSHDVIRAQLSECLEGIQLQNENDLIIAYEPMWAIGSGQTAEPIYAEEIQAFCRQVLSEILSPSMSQITIQYGGSVTPSNVSELLSQPDIDGLLIGGASLSIETFSQIIHESESILNLKVKTV